MNILNKVRGKVNSISLSNGVKANTKSATLSVLLPNICVPIYCVVKDVPVNSLPIAGQYLTIGYIENSQGKIFIKSFKKSNSFVTYCTPV